MNVDASERPSVARMYDYLLGGSHNFAADRQSAQRALDQMPDLAGVLRANRAFLGRAVRFLVDSGIRQFLDLGSGIPTVGNVHEIAQKDDPTIRVIYVDIDPIAVGVSESILVNNSYAGVIRADFCDIDKIFHSPIAEELLDLTEPLGVLLVSVLHFVPDSSNPLNLVNRLHAAVAPGSYLAMSHASVEERKTPPGMGEAQKTYAKSGNTLYPRTQEEIDKLLRSWQIQPPGLVPCPQWRPDPEVESFDKNVPFPGYAAVGYKAEAS